MTSFWKNKKVFLTGHTGFKGSWMTRILSSQGAEVTGFSLAPPTEPSLFRLCQLQKEMKSLEGDIRDFSALKNALHAAQPDVIIHMAAQALVRDSYSDPIGNYATNVMGTVHLFEAAKDSSAKVLVNVTSDKCYENREWDWGYRENEAMGGSDPYSASKGCAELVTQSYRKSFFSGPKSIRVASARAGNVIGGGDWAKDRLIPDAVRAFSVGQKVQIRSPHSTRPWQHVIEPVSGYLLLAEKLWEDATLAEGWNFGPDSDGARPVRWVMDRFCKAWGPGAEVEIVENKTLMKEATLLQLDCAKARNRLQWKPRLQAQDSVEWTARWYSAFLGGANPSELLNQDIRRFQEMGEK